MVRVEPVLERAVFLLQRLDLPCIENGGIDFQAVADNARVGKQAFAVGVVEARQPYRCRNLQMPSETPAASSASASSLILPD